MPRFGVDHNFPEELMYAARPFLGRWFGVEMIKRISGELIREKEDWEVMLALHQMGWDGLIGLDARILSSPKEMAVVEQTKFTVVAIESAGHDPLRAIGQVLVHARHIGQSFRADEPQVYRIGRPQALEALSPWVYLQKIGRGDGKAVFRSHRLTDEELARPVLP